MPKVNQRAVGYWLRPSAVMAPSGGHCRGSRASRQRRTIYCLLLADCREPSSTTKARAQKGGFPVTSSSNLLSPASNCVMSLATGTYFPLTSGRQPRAAAKTYVVWGVSWTPPDQQLERRCLVPGHKFSLGSLRVLKQ